MNHSTPDKCANYTVPNNDSQERELDRFLHTWRSMKKCTLTKALVHVTNAWRKQKEMNDTEELRELYEADNHINRILQDFRFNLRFNAQEAESFSKSWDLNEHQKEIIDAFHEVMKTQKVMLEKAWKLQRLINVGPIEKEYAKVTAEENAYAAEEYAEEMQLYTLSEYPRDDDFEQEMEDEFQEQTWSQSTASYPRHMIGAPTN